MGVNTEDLKAVSIVDVIGSRVPLKQNGREFQACCPFHKEDTPSFSVNPEKNIFKCFGCGESGDATDFIMKHENKTFQEAAEIVLGGSFQAAEPKKKKPKWQAIHPAPEECKNFDHFKHGKPSRIWTYRNEKGETLGYVCRFDLKEGKKEVLPRVFASNGEKKGWKWLGFTEPRPLYGLEKLSARPQAPVMIVEGEKAADAAEKLFPKNVVLSWIGGGNAIEKTNWEPIFGRVVILFPDADAAGVRAMAGGYITRRNGQKVYKEGLAHILDGNVARLLFVKNDPSKPKGWDVADEPDWTVEQAREYVKQRLVETLEEPQEDAVPPQPTQEEQPPLPQDFPDDLPPEAFNDQPEEPTLPAMKPPQLDGFRPMGYNKTETGTNEFFVYSKKARQVIRYTASGFSEGSLLQIADRYALQMEFPKGKGGQIDVVEAAQFIMNACYRKGVYDQENLRGIGAWMDGKSAIIHAGDHLIIDRQIRDLDQHGSRFIYEAQKSFGYNLREPLKQAEANELVRLFSMIAWERPVNAHLFAGWCVVAPVCGALYWRPHLWLTGGAGTGKTTAMNMLKDVLGKMAIHVQGNTSEAGIRQELGHNARPVIFDEADGDSRNDMERLQTILSLVRSSSSHDGGVILKGGATGSSKSFTIRSCFAFASISPQVSNAADKSRVTVLSLVKDPKVDSPKKWVEMQELMGRLLTEEWCERLQSRTVELLPILLENVRTFTAAAAAVFGDQRAGDQIGALLAGAYLLFSNGTITFKDAKQWIEAKDWSEIRSAENDEDNLFQHLMEQLVQVETGAGTRVDRSIGELVEVVVKDPQQGVLVMKSEAHDRLKRYGMKVDDKFLLISNSAYHIKKAVQDTPWAKGFNKILARIAGAENRSSTKFGGGIQTRAVAVPLLYFMEDIS